MPLHRKKCSIWIRNKKRTTPQTNAVDFNPINNVAAVQHVCYVANKV